MEALAPLLIVIICSLFFVPISECLSCYECSPSAQDDCTDPALWRTRTVSCPGFCYAYPSGSSVTLGCVEDPKQDCPERCCQTDLCNTGQPIDCYQCTYRNANGVISGHESCTRNHFDALHPQVQRRTCPFGCAVSEILAEDNNGCEYIISRDCAVWGHCPDNECPPGAASCTSCCHTDLCNDKVSIPEEPTDREERNFCFSCSYIKGPSGMINSPACWEPFNASGDGITTVPCDGECSLEVIRDSHSLIVRRGCQPGCDPSCTKFGDSENCRYCCSGNKCNSAPNSDLCNDKVSTPEEPTDREEKNECFSCSYIKGPSGMINSPACWEPFNASGDGITTVPCDGECSLEVIRDSHSLIVRRGCQLGCDPSCTKFGDSENCRYCCRGDKCNNAPNTWTGLYRTCVFGLAVLSLIRIFIG